jgi:hypothetical protein
VLAGSVAEEQSIYVFLGDLVDWLPRVPVLVACVWWRFWLRILQEVERLSDLRCSRWLAKVEEWHSLLYSGLALKSSWLPGLSAELAHDEQSTSRIGRT